MIITYGFVMVCLWERGLSEVIGRVEMLEIDVGGAWFWGLWGCGGGCVEGVWVDLEVRD